MRRRAGVARRLLAGLCLVLALVAAGCSVSIRPAGHDTDPSASPSTGAVRRPGTVAAGGNAPLVAAGYGSVTPGPGTETPTVTEPSPAGGAPPTSTSPAAGADGSGLPAVPPPSGQAPAGSSTGAPEEAGSTAEPAPTPSAAPPPPQSETPVPATPPSCPEPPVRGFGLVWADHPDIARRIGCPLGREVGVAARVQVYEGGFMAWFDISGSTPPVDDTPWVVTFAGSWANRYRIPQDWVSWDARASGPTGAFAWVWENAYGDRERLGNAVGPYTESDAAIQRFERGTMLWLRRPPGGTLPVVYVVEADLRVGAAGPFQAVIDRSFE